MNDVLNFSKKVAPVEELAKFYSLDNISVPERRPYAWLMYVMTLDGKVTFREPKAYGGDLIALQHMREKEERAIGAIIDWRLLQFGWAQADAIVGSAAIIRTEDKQTWPIVDDDILDYRLNVLGKTEKYPIKVILTASGDISLTEDMFTFPEHRTVVFASENGKAVLDEKVERLVADGKDYAKKVKIYEGGKNTVDAKFAVEKLKEEYGIRFLDVTGGPTVSGEFVWEKIIDEYRVTFAPHIIGEKNSESRERASSVILPKGRCFTPDTSVLFKLRDVRSYGSHTFHRYCNPLYRH